MKEELQNKINYNLKKSKTMLVWGIIIASLAIIASIIYGAIKGASLVEGQTIFNILTSSEYSAVTSLLSLIENGGIVMIVLSIVIYRRRANNFKKQLLELEKKEKEEGWDLNPDITFDE